MNWPSASDPIYLANPVEQNARKGFYGVSSVPWNQIDGVIHSSSFQSSYDTRMAVPCHLSILTCRNGTAESGTVSIRLIAEQDLGLNSLRLFATLMESGIPGTGYWSGSTFDYAFRDNLFGVSGPTVAFSAPYPDTLFFETPYTVSPGWTAANLSLATFVQEYSTSDKEVANSRLDNFLGLPTGIGDQGVPAVGTDLAVYPNPSGGTFTVDVPDAAMTAGTVTVFDVSGRTIFEGTAADLPMEITVAQTGLYLVRLATSDGTSVSRTVAVVR